MCPACLYGKQKWRPWRTKGSLALPIKKSTFAGQCISVDQLISLLPGLIGQTIGRLTTSRYRVATIFINHYSDIDYVHVQETTLAKDTLEAKAQFECFAQDQGVTIGHYHADNSIFASNAFRESVWDCRQTISFCGISAHHQNGVAEQQIQDLTGSAWASMAHAAHRNPAVTATLWPYALCYSLYVRWLFSKEGKTLSPDKKFLVSLVWPTTKFLHLFGCPVYVLKANLQSRGPPSKWDDRSRVGVYLGPSRHHASNMSLVPNSATGYVSPQFHCIYDNRFETPDKDANFHDKWAERAGLAEQHLSALPDSNFERALISRHFQYPLMKKKLLLRNHSQHLLQLRSAYWNLREPCQTCQTKYQQRNLNRFQMPQELLLPAVAR